MLYVLQHKWVFLYVSPGETSWGNWKYQLCIMLMDGLCVFLLVVHNDLSLIYQFSLLLNGHAWMTRTRRCGHYYDCSVDDECLPVTNL